MMQLGERASAVRTQTSSGQGWTWVFAAALYLITTSRWGAYVGLPGLPVFIGDVLVLLGVIQTVRHVRSCGIPLRLVPSILSQAPVTLLLTLALALWAGLRLMLGVDNVLSDPLAAARDAAPYGYAVVACLAFLLPVRDGGLQRRVIYTALSLHTLWVVGAGYLPGWPWPAVSLGDAPIFTTRPDVDSSVMGIATALAVSDFDHRRRAKATFLLAFMALNLYGITTQPTRAGFIAVTVAVAVALFRRATVQRQDAGRSRRLVQAGVIAAVGVAFAGAVALTPPGQRIVEGIQGLRGEQTQASGTIDVRRFVWGSLIDYTTADPARMSVGVGFGPDFIDASGTEYALEGTEYKDVRSPHNYVLGTFARLGLLGGLLVTFVLCGGIWLGLQEFRSAAGAVTKLAALVLLTTPVTASLGVILEAPFGAIPYFWALGQVAQRSVARRDGQGTAESERSDGQRTVAGSAMFSRYH